MLALSESEFLPSRRKLGDEASTQGKGKVFVDKSAAHSPCPGNAGNIKGNASQYPHPGVLSSHWQSKLGKSLPTSARKKTNRD